MSQQPFSSDNGFSTTGNITAGYLVGNGVSITGITATANIGDITFVNTTISAPTNDAIIIQAVDNDDVVNSSLELDPDNILTRLEQWSSQNSESFNTSDWSTGVYTNQGGMGAVQFTGAANMVDFVNSVFGATGHIFISVNGGPLLFLDGTGGGATDITFYTPTLPAVNPTLVTSFEYFYSYKSGFEIDYDSNEVNIYANDADITLLTTSQRDISLDSSGDVILTSNANGNTSNWTFGADGSLTFPIGISIDNSVDPVYPKIIADSGKLFSIQGQGANGSAAMAWSLNPNTDTQYAAVGVNQGGGDNLAKVVLTAGNTTPELKVWKFDQTGNITLPQGGIVYETNIPDGALSGSAIALKPAGGTTANQQLLIYPTANDGDHIHLTSGNLYATELFLGSDNLYVKLANTGNIVINSNNGNSSNAMWTFGNDGTTTFPAGNITSNTSLQFTTTFANVKTVEYQTAGVWDLYVEDSITGSNIATSRLNVSFKDNLIDKPQVYIENTKESDGVALRWTFDENGSLNFPRDAVGNTDPYLTITGGENPRILSEDASLAGPANLEITALNTVFTGNNGEAITIYPDDGEISGDANIQIWSNAVGNTQYSWTFDTTGNLTLPGNTFAVNYANGTPVSIGGGSANTGNVTFNDQAVVGTGDEFGSSGLYLAPGTTSVGNLQYIRVRGGDVATHIHLDTGNNAYFDQYFGDDGKYVKLEAAGNIVINTNDGVGNSAQWTFDTTGNATFPANGTTNLHDVVSVGLATFSTISVAGNVIAGNILVVGSISPSGVSSPAPSLSGFSSVSAINLSASGNITGGNILTAGQVSANGNITTANSFVGNLIGTTVSITGNVTASNVNVTTGLTVNGTPIVANNAANLNSINTMTTIGNVGIGGNLSVTGNIIGNGAGLTGVAKQTTGSWTVTPGTATYSFTVPAGTWQMWVTGNIPNGIIAWNATATITNTNVPVVGQQFAWVYDGAGTPLDFVSIPNQFTGTGNAIVRSNTAPSSTTNRFDFSINNTSGNTQTVQYGYTAL